HAENREVAKRFGLPDLSFDVDLLGVLGRWDLVRHVDDCGDAAAHRGGGAGREVFLVSYARITEVHVRVDETREDMEAARIDYPLAVRQRVAGADRHDLAICDGNAALQRGLRRDNRSILYDQIRFHEFPSSRSRLATRERREALIGVKHTLKIICVGGFREPK